MHDLIVVGAGLAGSSMAAAMARQGWDALLIERDTFPRHKVCGEFLSPEARNSLQNLGLRSAVSARHPISLTHARLTTTRGHSVHVALPEAAWGLSRYAFDDALAGAACRAGASLWSGTTVTHWQRSEGHFEVTVRRDSQQQTLSSRALVMACGRHSAADLPPKSTPRKYLTGWRRCVGIKSHAVQVDMPPQVEIYFVPGGYIGINPIEGDGDGDEEGRANVCALLTYEAFAGGKKSVPGAIEAAMGHNAAFAARMAGARLLPETALAVAPVDTRRQPEPWCGVACLGDTAAMIPPLCGDGMAMALRSTELCLPLADAYLRNELSLDGWAGRYTEAWQTEFNRRLWWGRWLQSAMGISALQHGLVRLGQQMPQLARLMVKVTRGAASVRA